VRVRLADGLVDLREHRHQANPRAIFPTLGVLAFRPGYYRNVSSDGRAREPFVSTTLIAGPEAPAQARRFLSKTVGPRRLQVAAETDVSALLITELVSNAVRHGSPTPRAAIEVRVTVAPRLLRVLIRDEGSGFDPDDIKTGDTQWGIHLVRELASRWGVEGSVQGTDVWFEMIS